MNLQQSLQVTSTLGEFDSHLLLALMVMMIAGVLGGLANHYLAERQGSLAGRQDWRRYLVFGVVTALTAPLLLNMLSSNLLEGARTRPGELYVFAAFCLIYVVAARRIFENPVALYQQQLEPLRRELEQLRREQETLRQKLEALPVAPMPIEVPQEKPEPRTEPREVVTYNDVEILRALADESYVYGNLAALTEKTSLGRELISQRLAVLKNVGLIDTRINDKNVLHWVISSRGRQVLTDVLTGQDDGKKIA
ncbi:MAG: YEATS-associated helix-containing protein [Azovibrio sp.]|uniref:YEATS-associated helix-containing protein n=1 Tax=Azovibrio sp. TaxID=1872673 RepID=UPI003C7608A3